MANHYIKNILLSFLFVFPVFAHAQISGKITDASQKSIPYCNVLLLRSSDSLLITGSTTDSTGFFQLEIKDTGTFYVAVNYTGYKKWKSNPIGIKDKKTVVNIGMIKLQEDSKLLKDVEVVAERSFMEHKIDRTVYNIQNSIIGAGFNGLEVLKKLPGVTVDGNDQISVRGKSGVLIMVDGRTSYMSAADAANFLKSLDASQIEKIEVITNPSSKFDASGNAVINIVLVKDKNLGLNAQVYGVYGQGFYSGKGGGFNMNYRTKKFNFFANNNSYYMKSYNGSDQKNIFAENGVTSAAFVDHWQQVNYNQGSGGRAGVDYEINKKQTLGAVAQLYWNANKAAGNDESKVYNANNEMDSVLNTATTKTGVSYNFGGNLNYKYKIDTTGKEFSANADYVTYSFTGNEEDVTRHATAQNLYPVYSTTLRYKLPETVNIIAANVDYEQPVWKNGKIETGLKASDVASDNNAHYWNVNNGVAVNDTGKTNHFVYHENIYAGYLNFSKPLSKKVEMQIGLRGESTNAKGIQKINDSTVKINYFKIFPSFFVNWKVDSSNTLNFSYSRRIDRPDYGDLNPFRFYRNPYTYSVGNPYLQPMLSDNAGIDYVYKGFFSASAGFLHMKNVISDATHQNDATHVLYTRSENMDTYNSYNILLTITLHPTKWWTSMTSVNSFYDHYFGNSPEGYYSKIGLTAIANLQNSFNLSHDWSFEINVFYRSYNVSGYVVNAPIFIADAGIRKVFAKGKATARLSCGDVFHTDRFSNTEKFQNINYTAKFYSDSQRVRLTLTWKLGRSQFERQEKQKSAQDEMNRLKAN